MCMFKTKKSNTSVPLNISNQFDVKWQDDSKDIFPHILAITNRRLCTRPFAKQIERVCQFHPKAVVLREKDMSEEEYLSLAKEIMRICNHYDVPCILHTYIHTARTLHCPAIHLPLPLLRQYQNEGNLSDFHTIGASVHSMAEALEAERLGATYLTAGHIYTTDCKKGVPPRGLSFLQEVCQGVFLPVYAIGGIQPKREQLSEVMASGAKGGCIMSGMMLL